MAGDIDFLRELEAFLAGLDWVEVTYARIAQDGAVDLGVVTDQRARLHVDLVARFGAGRVNLAAQVPARESLSEADAGPLAEATLRSHADLERLREWAMHDAPPTMRRDFHSYSIDPEQNEVRVESAAEFIDPADERQIPDGVRILLGRPVRRAR